MADLASLYIKVDSKGVVTASKDLNKLTDDSKKTETATEGVTRSFSKLQAVVVALASSYALLKMAQYIKDTALLAARYETLGVVMRVVGNNAGYTGTQMDKFARGLQKTGIAMVESRNTLARMIQAQIDLTSSQKLARIAQDAAVIGNLNSSEAFEHMIYGLQTGMPRILRTIGLNVDFNASVKALAVSLGIKKDVLNEAQIMQARVNAVMKAGVLITGTYEAAMGTAGKKLTSFIRYTEDFKVKMGLAFGPATVMLVDAATEAMKEFQDEISRPEAQKALRDLSSQLATTIVQLGQDLPKAIKSTTNAIADIQAIYNSLPSGVVGAAGAGLIGRILFGGWGPAKIVAGLYLINEGMSSIGAGLGDIVKSYKESVLYFGKAWDEITGKTVKGLEFFTIDWDENKFVSQFEKMKEMLAKGIPIKLDFALEDPDKYFGEMKVALVAWQKEGFESIKKWYKSLETLAKDKRDAILEFEDQETRMIKENLAYRLTMQEKYYRSIEAKAREKRDFEEELENQQIRMAREIAEYQKGILNEVQEYWEYTFENIHDATADTFYDIFKNIEDGFKGLIENVKNWFLRLLAEMATMAIANPIKIIIGTVGGALGLPGMAEAGEGLNGSIGTAITKWINQSPFGETGGLNQWGTTWGNMLSYAGIAFNTINAINALGEGNYGTAAGSGIGMIGGALIGGPIGAAIGGGIGSFLGGLIDNIFGGSNAGFGSSALMSGKGKWGEMPSFGDWTQMPRAGGPASTELIEGFEKAIRDTLQGMYDAIDGFSARMPNKIRKKFEAALADIEINYLPELEGLTGANIEGSFTFALTREQAANLEEYVKLIPTFILDRIAPALQNAISGWAGTFDLTLLKEDNPLQKLYDEILEGVQDGDWEVYFEKVDAFMNTMGAVEEIWASLDETIDNTLNPLSKFETALLNVNNQFDQWIATLEQLGFTEEAIAEIEAKRLLVIQKMIDDKANKEAAVIATQQRKLDIQLMELQGNSIEALAARRADELAAMDASLRATQLLIWARQDETTAVEQAVAVTRENLFKAQADLRAAFDAEKSKITNAYNAQINSLNTSLNNAKNIFSEMQRNVNKLRNAKERMRIEDEIFTRNEYQNAQKELDLVLSQAQQGDFSGLTDIDQTLNTLTDSNINQYTNSIDYQRNFYKTYKSILDLENLANDQLTIEEKTVSRIELQIIAVKNFHDKQIRAMNYQLDTLLDINTNILSIADAIAALNKVSAKTESLPIRMDRDERFTPPGPPEGWWPFALPGQDNVILISEVKKLREEMKISGYQNSKGTARIAKILDKFDGDGLPAERTA